MQPLSPLRPQMHAYVRRPWSADIMSGLPAECSIIECVKARWVQSASTSVSYAVVQVALSGNGGFIENENTPSSCTLIYDSLVVVYIHIGVT